MVDGKKFLLGLDSQGERLGDFTFVPVIFEDLDKTLAQFLQDDFKTLHPQEKWLRVSRVLCEEIQKSKEAFLIQPIISFIHQILEKNILDHYSFSSFELYLNQFSDLSDEDNYQIRGKIVGKWIPRDDYQIFFPVGMGKRYFGSHFVTAHSSPDLDTTVASFWGWVDAFGARVSEGLHIWNVPGGPPSPQIEIPMLFDEIFGASIFDTVPKKRSKLTLSSLDLMTQHGIIKKKGEDKALFLEFERQKNAVVLVNDDGEYLGDWRHFDVEGVRQVINSLNNCLRYLESTFQLSLISLFAKQDLRTEDLLGFRETFFNKKIRDYDPAKEFTAKQQKYLEDYLSKILKVEKGLDGTFREFAHAMNELHIVDFSSFEEKLISLERSQLFDKEGKLIENRPLIFSSLEKIVRDFSATFRMMRSYVEKLEIAMKIKTDVFGFAPRFLTQRTDIEEIKTKIKNYSHLTVNFSSEEGNDVPIGVIYASDLQKDTLGTVTLRDFCNRDEMNIPSYLEVISVIDHHKATLSTFSPPVAYISDAQSSNALVAELCFMINDRYSLRGMTNEEIKAQLEGFNSDLRTPEKMRLYRRLIERKMTSECDTAHYVHPRREFVEYLHFLYAIMDDTDLLTKVSQKDIECVAHLLNRLKTLRSRKEIEVVHFDDIPKDENFVASAATRLLQNEDFYSLYDKVYRNKETAVDENIEMCAKGKSFNLFNDTKVLNGVSRVGQLKFFKKNLSTLQKYSDDLRSAWVKIAQETQEENPECDLHLQMISTIASAKELYEGEVPHYTHHDELWFWIPFSEISIDHLKLFLNAFQAEMLPYESEIKVTFLGENGKKLSQIFKESFLKIERALIPEKNLPIAVLEFPAGILNSRKAKVSPYLPTLAP